MENISDRKSYSGGRYHAWLVVRALQDLGHDVWTMTDRVPDYVKELPGHGELKIIDRSPVLTSSNCILRSGDGKFDLVCVFPLRAIPWGVNIGRALRVPVFTWVFDPYALISLYAPDIAQRMSFGNDYLSALRASRKVVASTEVSRQYVKAYVGDGVDVSVLYPCANTRVANSVSPIPREEPDVFKIVAITRGTNHKRPEHIFRAFRDLIRAGVNTKLYVMSGFAPGRLHTLARRMDVKHSIFWEDRCSEERKWEIIKSADLMIGASTYEGFGLWLMEGIYALKPFVVYDFPIFKEIARGGGGWFANYNMPQSFSGCVQKAVKADLRLKIQHLTAIAPMFTFEAFKERVAELIKNV